MNLRRWLTLGIGVKRWLVVTFAGLVLLAVGTAHLLRQATQDVELEGVVGALVDVITLAFLPYALRGLAAGVLGVALFGYGAYRVVRALTEPVISWDGISRWSRSSTRSGSSPAGRGSWRSAAGPDSRRCCAG